MTLKFDPDTISFLITDVARLLRAEFDRRTSDAGVGLTPGEARILVNAARAGPIRQAALADRMGLEAMTLSTYLDRLEKRGLLTRIADPDDRRAKLVRVTEAADPVLAQISQTGAQLRMEMSETIEPARLEAVRQALREMRSRLIEMRPECARGSTKA